LRKQSEEYRAARHTEAHRSRWREYQNKYRSSADAKTLAKQRYADKCLANGKPRLYVITDAGQPGVVKIGRTDRCPQARLSAYNTASAYKACRYDVLIAVEDSKAAERAVHRALRGLRCLPGGEWFRTSADEVRALVLSEAVLGATCEAVLFNPT